MDVGSQNTIIEKETVFFFKDDSLLATVGHGPGIVFFLFFLGGCFAVYKFSQLQKPSTIVILRLVTNPGRRQNKWQP